MRLLFDARLPQSLAVEAGAAGPGAVEFVRWSGGDVSDTEFLESAARQRFDCVVLLDRDSLDQAELRATASRAGVAVVAVVADDPFEAKRRLVWNMAALRRSLSEHDCLLVFANEVRPLDSGPEDADAS